MFRIKIKKTHIFKKIVLTDVKTGEIDVLKRLCKYLHTTAYIPAIKNICTKENSFESIFSVFQWLKKSTDAGYNVAADLNRDGKIDNADVDIMSANWLASNTGIKQYYYHYDGLGSIIALTNETGQVAEKYEYDVFGAPIIRTANDQIVPASLTGNCIMFTAREYDVETGNYYYRARFYSPTLGRFLQTDPIGYSGGINLYAYCGNNPIILVDPYGLKYWDLNVTYTPVGILPAAIGTAIATEGLGMIEGGILGGLSITGGVLINSDTEEIYPYIGFSFTTNMVPTISGSVTKSQSNPSPGLFVQGTLNVGLINVQGGRAIQSDTDDYSWFKEKSYGWPSGGSAGVIATAGPYKIPGRQESTSKPTNTGVTGSSYRSNATSSNNIKP